MRIQFERTGGFAGMRLTATVDTDPLSPEEAREYQEMVEAASFFDLPPVIRSPKEGADRFDYTLTVEAQGQRHTVEIGEGSVPDVLRPLIQRLTAAARSYRGS